MLLQTDQMDIASLFPSNINSISNGSPGNQRRRYLETLGQESVSRDMPSSKQAVSCQSGAWSPFDTNTVVSYASLFVMASEHPSSIILEARHQTIDILRDAIIENFPKATLLSINSIGDILKVPSK